MRVWIKSWTPSDCVWTNWLRQVWAGKKTERYHINFPLFASSDFQPVRLGMIGAGWTGLRPVSVDYNCQPCHTWPHWAARLLSQPRWIFLPFFLRSALTSTWWIMFRNNNSNKAFRSHPGLIKDFIEHNISPPRAHRKQEQDWVSSPTHILT